MERLADYTESHQALRQKIGLAFIYPAMVTLVAGTVVLGLLTYVVPQVVNVFQNTNQTLPWLTRALIGLSDFLRASWLAVAGRDRRGGVGGAAGAAPDRGPRLRFHRWLLRLPLVGALVRGVNSAQLASTLGHPGRQRRAAAGGAAGRRRGGEQPADAAGGGRGGAPGARGRQPEPRARRREAVSADAGAPDRQRRGERHAGADARARRRAAGAARWKTA